MAAISAETMCSSNHERPELLFKLREVDEKDLIAKAGKGVPLSRTGPAAAKVLADDGLSELFSLDLGAVEAKKPKPKKPLKAGNRFPNRASAVVEPKLGGELARVAHGAERRKCSNQ
jgi:hypothetical protein